MAGEYFVPDNPIILLRKLVQLIHPVDLIPIGRQIFRHIAISFRKIFCTVHFKGQPPEDGSLVMVPKTRIRLGTLVIALSTDIAC